MTPYLIVLPKHVEEPDRRMLIGRAGWELGTSLLKAEVLENVKYLLYYYTSHCETRKQAEENKKVDFRSQVPAPLHLAQSVTVVC